ncbi:cytochrome c3 family protein [Roseibium sp. MMSF_3544]|uniref:cytochrome c3 family protein n=1 Tax=unclassified Roseibium TaxID=2629323 RepID=UPI00273F9620|nr:cytochrome c3 family protein [Roseibium sp. MMSF_3544]
MIALVRIALFVLAIGYTISASIGQETETPNYIGSDKCVGCHQDEMLAWQSSHHAKAWMDPSNETVDGDFNNTEFTHRGRRTRFYKTDEGFYIETTDFRENPKTFRVEGVGGIAPLQQYLIETEPGRLQSFDVVWDQEKEEWYHLYPEQVLPPDDGFHWSGPYKNWNARCAECHSTGFSKNYSLRERKYQSDWAEIGVGCEACHGPAEAHLTWAEQGNSFDDDLFPGTTEKGLVVAFPEMRDQSEVQLCAGCHSRREPFQDSSPLPGTPYHDAYRLALLRDGLYHSDGQIQDEVYVYGSFLQSKMHQNGVRCSDCHDPHDGQLVANGNDVCTQCHSPTGNDDFPSLALNNYDDPSHHFHESGTEGSLCISCHTIERTYMGIDGRRDHSFRIPRPDVSARIGTPNACTDCHNDNTPEWAAEEIERRFPYSLKRTPHFGEVFAIARNGSQELADDLLSIARQATYPAIVRATALDLLLRTPDSKTLEQAADLLDDPDPLVRASAVTLQRHAPPEISARHIVSALEDPSKAVRIAAARQLLTLQRGQVPEESVGAAQRATREWQSSLAAKSDFPETHMVLGGTALAMRNTAAAVSAFEEVTWLDPQLVEAWVYLVRLHLAQDNFAEAEFALQRALSLNPGEETLMALKNQLSKQ